MCTMTWHDTTDGYHILFNRDESRQREPAEAPALRRAGTTRFIAPLDGDHGGSWIAVNEFGLSACLLNGFSAGDRPARKRIGFTSRGLLTLAAVEQPSAAGVSAWLAGVDPNDYRPFVLVVFEPAGGGLVARWSGRDLEVRDRRPTEHPLVSSSFFTEEVRTSRVAVFRELNREGGVPLSAHLAFHRSHLPDRGPHSPCMHREDASTVSFSRVDVDAGAVRLHYVPHAPCRGLPEGPAAVLRRTVPSSASASG
jgi:hypothetical protein